MTVNSQGRICKKWTD